MSQTTSLLGSKFQDSAFGQHTERTQSNCETSGENNAVEGAQSAQGEEQGMDKPHSATDTGDTDNQRQAGNVFHAIGVLSSGGVFVTDGILVPGVGFPIAVGTLALLGIIGSPPANAPTVVLQTIRGGILTGGMKQGVLIKSLFGVALFIRGMSLTLMGDGAIDVTSLLLGGALFSTALGTAIDASVLSNRIAAREQAAQ